LAPWQGPRHRSWASNTALATTALAILFLTTLTFEIVGDAPGWLTQLLGASAGIWFGAVAGDKAKRDQEVSAKADTAGATADRAEAKADKLAEVAVNEHPEAAEQIKPPFDAPEEGKP
jgi:hypothetical protein